MIDAVFTKIESICRIFLRFSLVAFFAKAYITKGSQNAMKANEVNFNPLFCDTSFKEGILAVDCSNRNLILLSPQNLDYGVTELNLSHNKVLTITNWSFERYEESLVKLDVSYLRHYNESFRFDPDSFSRLRNLQYLDLSNKYECLINDPVLPRSIKILKIEGCRIRNWNFASLAYLEELHAARNEFNVFPSIHLLAPLRYLDLRDNPIWNFEIENIAPFCQLKTFLMQSFPPKHLSHAHKYHNKTTFCTCYNLNLWLTYIAINHDEIDCTLPADGSYPKCTASYLSNKALELRYNCLSRRYPSSPAITMIKGNWWWILLLLVIIFFIMGSGFMMMREAPIQKPRKNKKNKNRNWEEKQANETEEIPEMYDLEEKEFREIQKIPERRSEVQKKSGRYDMPEFLPDDVEEEELEQYNEKRRKEQLEKYLSRN